MRRRLKVEINPNEHFSVFGYEEVPFSVDSFWFSGSADVVTYSLDELLGTKLRALYQHKKGQDIFDLATALDSKAVDPCRIITVFAEYMKRGGDHVIRALFERNMYNKLRDPGFGPDVEPLLAPGCRWNL